MPFSILIRFEPSPFPEVWLPFDWKHNPDSKTNTKMTISSVTRGQNWKKEMREIQLSEILFTISVVVEWAFLRDFQLETIKKNWVK